MATEDLTSIDVSQLDALARLEADHRAIEALSNKATWRRDRELEIYARVTADYEARMTAIAEQAAPVRARVREDLQALETLCQHAEAAVDQARAALQECEFRREIGEFTPEQYQQSQQAAEQVIGEREAEFEALRTLRQRYLDLLPGEPVVRVAPSPRVIEAAKPAYAAAAAVAPAAAAPAAAPPAAAPAAPVPAIAPRPDVFHQPEVPVPVAPVAPAAESSTMFLPPPSAEDFKVASSEPDPDSGAFATMAISAAMLIEDRGGLPGSHHRLGPSTTIGRAPENEIVVPIKEVSRRHAQILVIDDGYVLTDLGSPNGTFINGTRVMGNQRLRDGDKVTVGGKEFLFTGPS
jgi:hypothetical protein